MPKAETHYIKSLWRTFFSVLERSGQREDRRRWGGEASRDVPRIVLDPEVSAKLHGLVCGAEL